MDTRLKALPQIQNPVSLSDTTPPAVPTICSFSRLLLKKPHVAFKRRVEDSYGIIRPAFFCLFYNSRNSMHLKLSTSIPDTCQTAALLHRTASWKCKTLILNFLVIRTTARRAFRVILMKTRPGKQTSPPSFLRRGSKRSRKPRRQFVKNKARTRKWKKKCQSCVVPFFSLPLFFSVFHSTQKAFLHGSCLAGVAFYCFVTILLFQLAFTIRNSSTSLASSERFRYLCCFKHAVFSVRTVRRVWE